MCQLVYSQWCNFSGQDWEDRNKQQPYWLQMTVLPRANAYAARWVRSVGVECLDQVIILDQRHLAYVLREYERYFNTARPHQGMGQALPDPPPVSRLSVIGNIQRHDILGGVIHDYFHAA